MTSYMKYFPGVKNRAELMHITSKAPDGKRYCNGLCQEYKETTDFNAGGPNLCHACSVVYRLFVKKLQNGIVTLEEFQADPSIVHDTPISFSSTKECLECKETKTIDLFEEGRRCCKACKAAKTLERNTKDFDVLISDVEKAKNNIEELEAFLNRVPKDKLVKILSHFKIGRKSRDRKPDMVFNAVEHFRKLIVPTMCQGGCGRKLDSEFSTCEACALKGTRQPRVKKLVDFEENLPQLCDSLTSIGYHESDDYTVAQLLKIARYMGIPDVKQSMPKMDMLGKINAFLKTRIPAESPKVEEEKPEKVFDICSILNIRENTIVTNPEDGYINLTALCQAVNKQYKHWNENKSASQDLDVVSAKIGIPVDKLVYYKPGSIHERATYGHPHVAMMVACWASRDFCFEVMRRSHQMSVTGSCSEEEKMETGQIMKLQLELAEEQKQHAKLQKKHEAMKLRRQYHKFQKGPAFYVVQTSENRFKIGFDDVDVNARLQTYRTLIPDLKVRYIVHTSEASTIERLVLSRFADYKLEVNHEIVYDVEFEKIANAVATILSFCLVPHTMTSQEELDKYNN